MSLIARFGHKFVIVLFAACLHTVPLFAQKINYKKVDREVKKYPNFVSIDSLASRIETDFLTKKERIRAIFSWMINNIEYDVEKAIRGGNNINVFSFNEKDSLKKVTRIMKALSEISLMERKAICSEYTFLFYRLCNLLNIECAIIAGSAKSGLSALTASPNQLRHTWNAVKLNNEWQFIDVTWGAGYIDQNIFVQRSSYDHFLIPGDRFVLDHYPDENKWLPVGQSYDLDAFLKAPIFFPLSKKRHYVAVPPSYGILVPDSGTVTIFLEGKHHTQGIHIYTKSIREPKYHYIKKTNKPNVYELTIPTPSVKDSELYLIQDDKPSVGFLIKAQKEQPVLSHD